MERKEGSKEREDAYRLWETCFSDSRRYMDFYFQEVVPKNKTLTLYEGDVLTSMLHLNPYSFSFGTGPCTLHYMVGVATEPAYRKQGRMRRLMGEALRYLHGEGEPVTYLMPADEAIYLPFGFRFAYTQERMRLKVESLREASSGAFRATPWDQCGREGQREACAFANGKIRGSFNAYAVKTPEYYRQLQREASSSNGDLLVLQRGGSLGGVVSYFYEDEKLELVEAVCEGDASVAAVKAAYDSALEIHGKGVRSFDCLEASYLALPETYILERESKPIIMMRIVDVGAFLSHLPGRDGEQCEFRIKDDWIPENDGAYRVLWNGGEACVTRSDSGTGELWTVEELFERFRDRLHCFVNEIV